MKENKALRIAVQNKQERQEKGIDQLFPRLQKSESTNELKARQIGSALQYSLDEVERQIIEDKYLSTSMVYLDLGRTKDQFYTKK